VTLIEFVGDTDPEADVDDDAFPVADCKADAL
jgi:hypothetical protein